jgi:chromosome partitioning protein
MVGSIIVVASSKGGAAKTVTVTALAVNLAGRGFKVHVVDSDRNQAFMNWFKIADAPPLTVSACINQEEIVSHLMEQAEKCDVCLVDCAGFENQTAVFAMAAATCVLTPVMPDRNSVLEARKTAKQVASVSQIARRSINHRIILSRWNPRGLAERATLEDLQAAGLQPLNQHIPDLTAFAKATFSGNMPHTGFIGHTISKLIEELKGLDAIPSKPSKELAA